MMAQLKCIIKYCVGAEVVLVRWSTWCSDMGYHVIPLRLRGTINNMIDTFSKITIRSTKRENIQILEVILLC